MSQGIKRLELVFLLIYNGKKSIVAKGNKTSPND
jgi:hypothetical protein